MADMVIEYKEKFGDYTIFVVKKIISGLNYEPCYWRCGYVTLPEWHKLFGVYSNNYEEKFDVHGGVTYSGNTLPFLKGEWAIGFDCNQTGDYLNKWTTGMVIAECKKLLKQLKEVEGKNRSHSPYEFYKVCVPVINYLRENGMPHCKVIITDEDATLTSDEIHFPLPKEKGNKIPEEALKVLEESFLGKRKTKRDY